MERVFRRCVILAVTKLNSEYITLVSKVLQASVSSDPSSSAVAFKGRV